MTRPVRLIAATVVVALMLLGAPVAAVAGPDTGLCAMNTDRGAVSPYFVLDACVTGDAIIIENDTILAPYRLVTTGAVEPVANFSCTTAPSSGCFLIQDNQTYSQATRNQADASPGILLLPGDKVRMPVGDAGGSAQLLPVSDKDLYFFYFFKTLGLTALPGVIDGIINFSKDLDRAQSEYLNCVAQHTTSDEVCSRQQEAAWKASLAKNVLSALPISWKSAKAAFRATADLVKTNWKSLIAGYGLTLSGDAANPKVTEVVQLPLQHEFTIAPTTVQDVYECSGYHVALHTVGSTALFDGWGMLGSTTNALADAMSLRSTGPHSAELSAVPGGVNLGIRPIDGIPLGTYQVGVGVFGGGTQFAQRIYNIRLHAPLDPTLDQNCQPTAPPP